MFSPGLTVPSRMKQAVQQTSRLRSIAAPMGGWNARDAMSEMKPTDAIVLDNFIPDSKGVQQRRGTEAHATGITGNFVESLMEYNVAGANPKLFAAAQDKIWDATAAATASAVVTGLTNGRWQHARFSTPGNDYLVICNGADSVRNYNGASWSTPAITGVTSSTLVNVHGHMERLWFVQQSTLKVWYLGSQSIAGTANAIDFGPITKHGGELVAMGTWTRDGGSGPDDLAVFVTSQGEILLYSGTDPSSANTWARVGIFKAPPPIGKRCLIKLGADLCYLSAIGILPLPQFLSGNSADVNRMTKTDKISGAFKDAYRDSGTFHGWQVLEYPKENLLIINVPITERATQHQYVMNLQTGAWCRFKDLNAGCWSLKGQDLFFGGNDGKVYAYGASGVYDDDGDPVTALGVQAFSNFGTSQQKAFKMARPLIAGPQDYAPQVKMLIDYDAQTLPTFNPTSYESLGPFWDEELWDTAEWGTGLAITNQWQTVTGTGVVGALAMASQVTTVLIWNQTDVLYEPGGIL
jgi:hypothetical protein